MSKSWYKETGLTQIGQVAIHPPPFLVTTGNNKASYQLTIKRRRAHPLFKPYFFFRVGIMKCRVRILIVSVVVGFILKYNHYYYYYYYHPYPALNNPNPKTEVWKQ